jgi:hypothetical protein
MGQQSVRQVLSPLDGTEEPKSVGSFFAKMSFSDEVLDDRLVLKLGIPEGQGWRDALVNVELDALALGILPEGSQFSLQVYPSEALMAHGGWIQVHFIANWNSGRWESFGHVDLPAFGRWKRITYTTPSTMDAPDRVQLSINSGVPIQGDLYVADLEWTKG